MGRTLPIIEKQVVNLLAKRHWFPTHSFFLLRVQQELGAPSKGVTVPISKLVTVEAVAVPKPFVGMGTAS